MEIMCLFWGVCGVSRNLMCALLSLLLVRNGAVSGFVRKGYSGNNNMMEFYIPDRVCAKKAISVDYPNKYLISSSLFYIMVLAVTLLCVEGLSDD